MRVFKKNDFSENEENHNKLKEVIDGHKKFLSELFIIVKKLGEANPEIFRRVPEKRIKTVFSILRKINTMDDTDFLFERIEKVEDVAGLRLTIATKDDFDKAFEIIKPALEDKGLVHIKRENGKCMDPETGYAANHYIISKKTDTSIKCELQIRTLTQDLWAVFTHYEEYKLLEKVEESRKEEIVNYSRLMDVSDHYAKLIKDRKIRDANLFFKNHSPNVKADGLITVQKLQNEFYKKSNKGKPKKEWYAEKIETKRIIEIIKELHEYDISCLNDFYEVVNNENYLNELSNTVLKKREERKLKNEMDILEGFIILCKCRKENLINFKNGEIDDKTLLGISKYVDEWIWEAVTENQINFGNDSGDDFMVFFQLVEKATKELSLDITKIEYLDIKYIYQKCNEKDLSNFFEQEKLEDAYKEILKYLIENKTN